MTTRRQFTICRRREPPPACWRRRRSRARKPLKWRMVTSWPKRLPGPGMSAERVAEPHPHAVGRAHRHRRLCGGRGGAGLRGAGRGRQRRRRHRPHRLVLLAGQDAGGGLLHHRAVRPDAVRARRLDRGRRRAGAVGRALRAVRGQAVHGRQYRRLHGRLVPPRAQEPRRSARAQAALARPRRRGLSPARRHAADHAAGGNPHQPAIGRDRRRRIRRARHRHRARALSRGAVLLLSRLQQAERHRRVHRRAQGVERARRRTARRSSRMPARRRRITRWPRWSGSTRRRWTRW